MRFQVADDIAEFVRRETEVNRSVKSLSQTLASRLPDRTWTCGGSSPSLE